VITPPVHFIVDNGVVNLVGTVPSDGTHQRILMVVQRIPGVTQVVDQLQVNATGTDLNAAAGGSVDTSGVNAGTSAQVGVQNPQVGVQNQNAITAGANAAAATNLSQTSTRDVNSNAVFATTNQFPTGLRHGPQFPPNSRTGLPPGLQREQLPPGLQGRPLPPGLEMQRTNTGVQ